MTPIKFCFLSLLLIVTGFPATAETLMGQVVGVHDGDTLTLLVQRQPVNEEPCGTHRPAVSVIASHAA